MSEDSGDGDGDGDADLRVKVPDGWCFVVLAIDIQYVPLCISLLQLGPQFIFLSTYILTYPCCSPLLEPSSSSSPLRVRLPLHLTLLDLLHQNE